ncbi:MAG: PIN domain-containing protein [Verrucomicrobia bacterium]|nr:MAG: PIN domain-containing protein [Verrucomicrobiota bacterium]
MKLLDVNIWLALVLSGHTHHRAARAWLDGEQEWTSLCFCRVTQQGLLRLLTTAGVLAGYGNAPLSNRQAWDVIDGFMEDGRFTFANEPEGVEETWKALAIRDTHSPKLWMDAYLAAFAVRSGFQMITTDKAFSQFSGLDLLVLHALTT